MPKFFVHLQQYVEKIATIEVEARDEQAARTIAKGHATHAEWIDGDDTYAVDVYAVSDEAGDQVWER